MPATTTTPTETCWPKAKVDAPDATHDMALVYFYPEASTVKVWNQRGDLIDTYQLTSHTMHVEALHGETADGPITVKPDRRCACTGYKRQAKQ